MLAIEKSIDLAIPEDVEVSVNAREITVKGARGTLTKSIRHMALDVRHIKSSKGDKVQFIVWHGGRKHLACLRTAKSVVNNMIKGVTLGFQYKCRAVYAHFPINMIIQENGTRLEVRNFLGEKRVRRVNMREGVTVREDPVQKDQVLIEGNDVNLVSLGAADLHGQCLVKNKDIRKFLDGIYVADKSTVVKPAE